MTKMRLKLVLAAVLLVAPVKARSQETVDCSALPSEHKSTAGSVMGGGALGCMYGPAGCVVGGIIGHFTAKDQHRDERRAQIEACEREQAHIAARRDYIASPLIVDAKGRDCVVTFGTPERAAQYADLPVVVITFKKKDGLMEMVRGQEPPTAAIPVQHRKMVLEVCSAR